MKQLPAISTKLKGGNDMQQSDLVIALNKHNDFVIGVYFHDLNEWHFDGHFRDDSYVIEWWPMPVIGTGNK